VSIVTGALDPMPLLPVVRLLFVWGSGFSPALLLLRYRRHEWMLSGILAVARIVLVWLEECLSMIAPLISISFPAYLPLIYAFVFACSNLAHQCLLIGCGSADENKRVAIGRRGSSGA
jgi:hypothetical protein